MGSFALVSVVIGVAGYFLSGAILDLLGTPGDAAPLAHAYLRVIFMAMPPLLLLTLAMMALRGSGDSMTPLWFMMLAVLLDGALNPVFILGLGPAPRLGIAGSATATLIANYGALIGLFAYIYLRDLPLRLRGKELRYLWCDVAIMKTIVVKGFPMGLQMIIISLSALALVGLVNREGVDTTAAFGVAMQLWTYVQMPAMALGAAVSAMAAQNIGAGLWHRVGRITRVGIVQALAITAVMIAALTLSDRAVLGLFMGGDSAALPIARHIHLVATWNFLLFGVMMVLFGTVRANGAVWVPLVVLAIGLVPVRFGYIFATYGWLGADAIWTSFPVTSAINLALAIGFYLHGGWRKARMTIDERPSEDECIEEALATREPGGALRPAG
jgi:putative MATE family efflux protein